MLQALREESMLGPRSSLQREGDRPAPRHLDQGATSQGSPAVTPAGPLHFMIPQGGGYCFHLTGGGTEVQAS